MNCSKLVNNTDLRLLNINFRSIMNKRAEFIHLIDSLKPDIIVGTKTWLSDSIKNSKIIPDNMNFTIYRRDREDSYGGVMIAISKCIPSVRLQDLQTSCEILWVKLDIPTCKDLYLCGFYRPHLSDLPSLEQLNDSLNKLMNLTRDPTIWLSGDFNAPDISWQVPSVLPGSSNFNTHQLLIDISQHHGLSQMVTEPTRLNNTLDLFFTNLPTLIQEVEVVPGLSDHDAVIVQSKMRMSLAKQANRKIPLYSKANWQAIRADLQSLENKISDLILQGTDVDSVWRKFRDSILLAINQHVPHKMSRKHLSLPWITTQLRRQIRRRNILYCRAKHLGSTDIYNKFLDLKHSIQRDLRKSYWQYINGLISFEPAHGEHQKQKKFWSYIKSLKKDHARISSLNTPDGLVTDDTQKAEALNTQFKSVFTIEQDGPLPDKGPSPHPTMPEISITTSGISKLLQNLNIHKAMGPDQINAKILRELQDILAPTLEIIFNHSLNTGIVPSDWKMANITPLFKKGDRSQPNNYRPISLTSIVSKLFEHILSSNIRKHLESNNILHHCQHGFRQFHSCETQLISLVQDLTLNFDEDIQTDLVSMDFVKAFDTVPHHGLLYKLQWYGIQGKVHQWISNFLTNRRQKVILGNAHSSLVDVSSGVPQGTVLGPILFLIYINDLPDCVRYSTIRLFADDCIIYRPIKSIEDTQLLQEDINAIAK